jgi:antitoxin ParD1/3/4
MAASPCVKRTFSIPSNQGRYIDRLVGTGAYASASEVVRAGLRALEERDAAIERWLKEEVVPAYDALAADPNRAIPASKVFSAVRRRSSRRGARKA